MNIRRGLVFCLMLAATTPWAGAGESLSDGGDSPDLFSSSLEELMQVKLVTPSRQSETLLDTPSASYIITGEDIRRSGATSVPDALRLAPGVSVSRIDLSRWAVSMRGFHSQYSKNLLVLADGRSVYTPVFSGTHWDNFDFMLEDIDRIEVVRGPGATTWGANAVNGVINVISKSAEDTQGGLISLGGGTTEEVFGALRYGGKINDTTHYRVYVKGFERDGFDDNEGEDTGTSWDAAQTGFRMDGEPSAWDSWTLQGDLYESDSTIAARPSTPTADALTYQDVDNSGGNLLGRWNRTISESSSLRLQAYYDRVDRDLLPALRERRDTIDLDVQHDFALTDNQQLVYGAGYRFIHEDSTSGRFITFDPEERDSHLYSAFIQDNIRLMDDRLTLTFGSKFEDHEYTGLEVQPDARALYKLTAEQSVWAAVSRAVRTPSRLEYEGSYLLDIAVENQQPVLLTIFGNDDQQSEEVLAYETGYRAIPNESWIFDIALYYYDYDNLVSAEPGADIASPVPGGPTIRPYYSSNDNEGEGYGGEMSTHWIACDWASFQASYSLGKLNLENSSGGTDSIALLASDKSPQHMVSLQSLLQLARNVEFDVTVRYVDELSGLDVPSYWNADVRLGWMMRKDIELAVVGQNLLEDQHAEFKTQFYNGLQTEIERSVYGKITWMF